MAGQTVIPVEDDTLAAMGNRTPANGREERVRVVDEDRQRSFWNARRVAILAELAAVEDILGVARTRMSSKDVRQSVDRAADALLGEVVTVIYLSDANRHHLRERFRIVVRREIDGVRQGLC